MTINLPALLDKQLIDHHVQEKRNYIGASQIGNPCQRAIWYDYKHYPKKPYSAKQLRTFEIGKRLESMILSELTVSNIKWSNYDIVDTIPFFRGTCDAILSINDQKYILEIKTAKDVSFKKFIKLGLKDWNKQYYAQIQTYMGLYNIEKGILLAINKDTSELHQEEINFDPIYYMTLKSNASYIAEQKEPPERINKSPLFYICSMCQYKELCHG